MANEAFGGDNEAFGGDNEAFGGDKEAFGGDNRKYTPLIWVSPKKNLYIGEKNISYFQ